MIVRAIYFLIACVFVFSQSFCMYDLPLIPDDADETIFAPDTRAFRLPAVDGLGTLGQTVTFTNPCFPRFSQIENIDIGNGDIVNFACGGVVGALIRHFSDHNDVPNPDGLTHTGVALNFDPRTVWDVIYSQTPREENRGINCNIKERAGKAMMEKLIRRHGSYLGLIGEGELKPFLFEANGTVGQVFSGILPHVQISPFEDSLIDYGGNVFLRSINFPVSIDFSKQFMSEYIGRPYENFFTFRELFRATRDGNTEERTENVFCTELANLYLRGAIEESDLPNKAELIEERFRNASNAIPEDFSSRSGQYDLLLDLASPDVMLKQVFTPSE